MSTFSCESYVPPVGYMLIVWDPTYPAIKRSQDTQGFCCRETLFKARNTYCVTYLANKRSWDTRATRCVRACCIISYNDLPYLHTHSSSKVGNSFRRRRTRRRRARRPWRRKTCLSTTPFRPHSRCSRQRKILRLCTPRLQRSPPRRRWRRF